MYQTKQMSNQSSNTNNNNANTQLNTVNSNNSNTANTSNPILLTVPGLTAAAAVAAAAINAGMNTTSTTMNQNMLSSNTNTSLVLNGNTNTNGNNNNNNTANSNGLNGNTGMIDLIMCKLTSPFHVINDPRLLECGSSACFQCIISLKDNERNIKCTYCNGVHKVPMDLNKLLINKNLQNFLKTNMRQINQSFSKQLEDSLYAFDRKNLQILKSSLKLKAKLTFFFKSFI